MSCYNTLMKILFAVALALAAVFVGPFLLIWSLDTLFPVLSIPYTFQTLVAALLLIILLSPTVRIKK